jgi:hypothetical protein
MTKPAAADRIRARIDEVTAQIAAIQEQPADDAMGRFARWSEAYGHEVMREGLIQAWELVTETTWDGPETRF